jgi:hypothetical protein
MAKKQPTTQAQDTPPALAQQASEGDLLALVIEAFKRIEAGQDKVIAQNNAIAEHVAYVLAEVRDTKKARRDTKRKARVARQVGRRLYKAKRRKRWARRFKKK